MSTVSAPTIGRPGDLAAVRSFTLDDVIVTYVVDGVVATRPEKLFAEAPADAWAHLGNPAGGYQLSTSAESPRGDARRPTVPLTAFDRKYDPCPCKQWSR
jgi:hypothetical protein